MNLFSYLSLISLIFLVQIISHSSGDDWKKLKRKLIALTLLHSIRVKNIIPLPVPLPLPVVIRKVSQPIILPPKRVPFLVPKPVPVYHFVPKFVPIYSEESDYSENYKHNNPWPEVRDHLPQSQQIHEKYLPLNDFDINQHMVEWDNKGQHRDVTNGHQNGYTINGFQGWNSNQYTIPTEKGLKFKQNTQRFEGFKDIKGMLKTSQTKTRPEKTLPNILAQSIQKNINTNDNQMPNNGQPLHSDTSGLTVHSDAIKHILSDVMSKGAKGDSSKTEDKTEKKPKMTEPLGVKTSMKRIKVGEIRLKPHELRALLDNKQM